jgi:hypothetical protein
VVEGFAGFGCRGVGGGGEADVDGGGGLVPLGKSADRMAVTIGDPAKNASVLVSHTMIPPYPRFIAKLTFAAMDVGSSYPTH